MIRRAFSFRPALRIARLSRLLGLACLAAMIGSTTASAYSLTGKTWPSGSNIVMQMSLGDSPLPLLDGSGHSRNNAAAPALDMWNAHMGRIQFGRVMNSTAPSSSGDRVNSVVFSNSVFGQSFGVGTLAVTYYIMSGNNLLEADILFNTAQTFDSYRGPLRFGANGYATGDLRRVFLHELGHALGLNHSSADSIMSESTSDRETLSSDDIAGVQAMYGAPSAPPPPPTPTPTPTPAPPPPSANPVRGDFTRDGKPDLIWQNNATGQRAIWIMDGSTWVGERFLPTATTDWHISATADFNNDGHSDLLWQNNVHGQITIWLMDGTTPIGQWWLPTIPTQWQIAAASDFSGDGKTDIVWQNTSTGQRAIWLMDGGNWVGERFLPTIPVEWQIASAGDFNSDGHVDLVWQNNRTGQRAIWLMNRTTWVGERFLPTVGTDWQIAANGDFNGDGQTDLVWQNNHSGQRAIWLMNGSTWVGERFLPTVPTIWDMRNR
jgi:hypothetical protein